MLSKKDMWFRLCDAEEQIEWLYERVDKLDKRIKKLEPKKEKKSATKK